MCPCLSGMAANESVPCYVAPMSSLIKTSAGSMPRNSLCFPFATDMAHVLALPDHTFTSDSTAPSSLSSLASQAPLSCREKDPHQAAF